MRRDATSYASILSFYTTKKWHIKTSQKNQMPDWFGNDTNKSFNVIYAKYIDMLNINT